MFKNTDPVALGLMVAVLLAMGVMIGELAGVISHLAAIERLMVQ